MNKNKKINRILRIILLTILSVVIIAVNLCLFGYCDKQIPYTILTSIVDIILILIITGLNNKRINNRYNAIKQNANELVSLSSIKMERIIENIKNYNESSVRCQKALKLLSFVDASPTSKGLLNYFDNIENQRYIKSRNQIFNTIADKNDIPSDYTGLQIYIEKSEKAIKENDKTITDINNDLYNKKELKRVIKRINAKKYQETKNKCNCSFKNAGIMILLLIILIGFITVRIFFSPLYAVNIAKTSYLEKYNYQDILAAYGLSDISIKDENFSNFYSSGDGILLNFRITAKSSQISKYYTTTEDSDEAKDLLGIMRAMYREMVNKGYRYQYANVWEIHIYADNELIITDEKGNTYEYNKYDDGFEYLKINDHYVIYNM